MMADRIELSLNGEKIIGVYSKGKKYADTCVISCHGLLASKDSIKYLILEEELTRFGISSIRFDFRGCGESDGILGNSHISNRLDDLNAMVNYAIEQCKVKKIGLFGSSLGGYVAILQACSNNNLKIKALVTLAAPFSMSELFYTNNLSVEFYEVDGILFGREFLRDVKKNGTLKQDILQQITCPTLIFHGDYDGLVPEEHAHRLFYNLKSEKKLEIIHGGDHMFSNPFLLREIIDGSVEWFKNYLLG
jgi:pimeloyl-ACP methyl ester carboxylesterase